MKHLKNFLFTIVSGSIVKCVTSDDRCCPGEFYVDGNVRVLLNNTKVGPINKYTTDLFKSYEGAVRLYQTYELCFKTTLNSDGTGYVITNGTKFVAEVEYATVDDVTYYPAADFVPGKIPSYVLAQIDKNRTIAKTSPLQTVASTNCSTVLVADKFLELDGVGLNTEASAKKDVELNFQTGVYGFTSSFTTLGYGKQQAGVEVRFEFNGTMFSGNGGFRTSSIHSDPHYTNWLALQYFDFQGSCDQIAIDSPLLQMQIRTRPRAAVWGDYTWSGVSQVAVLWKPKKKVIFAFDHEGIKNQTDPGLIIDNTANLTDIVNYTIIDNWYGNLNFPQSYRFTFLQGNTTANYIQVSFSAILDSYNIDVSGNALSFRNSVGVLGSWNNPTRFPLRDGTTVPYAPSLENIKSWRVLLNESILQSPSEICLDPEDCRESKFGCNSTLLFNEPVVILSEPEHCGLSCDDIENAMMREFCETDVKITNNTIWACQMSYLDPVHKHSEDEPPTKSPTTAGPTNAAPTTPAPTTMAPTTAAPTAAVPTTMAPTKVKDKCVNLKKSKCRNTCVFSKRQRHRQCHSKSTSFEHDCAQYEGKTLCLENKVCKFPHGKCVHKCDGRSAQRCRKRKFCNFGKVVNPCFGCHLVTACGPRR